jgi:hypothetical protein
VFIVVAASCLPTSHPAFQAASHRAVVMPRRRHTAAAVPMGRPLGLAAVLVLLALVLVPEHPGDQEAICQRHNSAAACRVW